MSKDFVICIDEFNKRHIIKEEISRGGQGIVYRTKDPDTAIKLVTDTAGDVIIDTKIINHYLEEIKKIRFLPIPDELNITYPAARLAKKPGYVMAFLDNMIPISYFIVNDHKASFVKDEEVPSWLNEMKDKNAAKQIVYYMKTGSLRSRLLALYKTSSQLAFLHGAGLVYGDISHNNIFFLDNNDEKLNFVIWLIDIDNLRYEGEKWTVYTPGYAAPEIMQGKGYSTTASDCHAFAVLAYEMLTMVHPFIGKKAAGVDCDWAQSEKDADPKEQALMGNYPWVGDENDDSNSSDEGLPPALLYNDEIAQLFQKTFGGGRTDPLKRPVIFHWSYAFARAADAAIECNNCGMSFRYDAFDKCPYCENSLPPMIVMETYYYTNNIQGKKKWLFAREIPSSGIINIPTRVFTLFSIINSDETVMEIKIYGEHISFKKQEDQRIKISIAECKNEEGEVKEIFNSIRFARNNKFHIYASSDNIYLKIICSIKEAEK